MKASLVDAVGPSAPMEEKDNGARQSTTPFDFTLIPWLAVASVAELAKEGAAKYGPHNWRGLSTDDNINHVIQHLCAHLSGDRSEGTLGHLQRAAFRALMALETAIIEKRHEPYVEIPDIATCPRCRRREAIPLPGFQFYKCRWCKLEIPVNCVQP